MSLFVPLKHLAKTDNTPGFSIREHAMFDHGRNDPIRVEVSGAEFEAIASHEENVVIFTIPRHIAHAMGLVDSAGTADPDTPTPVD